jgi:hypothetical protein
MQEALNNQHGKIVYKDYIFAINNYLIPFFGRKFINNISYADFLQFEKYRVDKMGKTPKSSTIGTHNSAFNRVYDEAIKLGYLPSDRRLELSNRGKKSERRPDFTIQEYTHLYRTMRTWINGGRKGKSREMRHLLRDYVLILANTGIRPGTEAMNLKWHSVYFFEKDGDYGQVASLIFVNQMCDHWIVGAIDFFFTGGVKVKLQQVVTAAGHCCRACIFQIHLDGVTVVDHFASHRFVGCFDGT